MAAKQNPKVQEAMRLIRDDGLNPYAAAQKAGAIPSSVYWAVRAAGLRPKCTPTKLDPNIVAVVPLLEACARRNGWPAVRRMLAA